MAGTLSGTAVLTGSPGVWNEEESDQDKTGKLR